MLATKTALHHNYSDPWYSSPSAQMNQAGPPAHRTASDFHGPAFGPTFEGQSIRSGQTMPFAGHLQGHGQYPFAPAAQRHSLPVGSESAPWYTRPNGNGPMPLADPVSQGSSHLNAHITPAGGHAMYRPRSMSITDGIVGQNDRSVVSNGKKRSRSPEGDRSAAGKRPSLSSTKSRTSTAGSSRVPDKDGNPTAVFQCRGFGDCTMTFTRSEHLARHIRKHTGERPFQCHCGKSFSRLDNLRQHASTVHSDETELNEATLHKLTNLHSNLAAAAAQSQHAQALVVVRNDSNGNGSSGVTTPEKSKAKARPASLQRRRSSKAPGSSPPKGDSTGFTDGIAPFAPSDRGVGQLDVPHKIVPSHANPGFDEGYDRLPVYGSGQYSRQSDPAFAYGGANDPSEQSRRHAANGRASLSHGAPWSGFPQSGGQRGSFSFAPGQTTNGGSGAYPMNTSPRFEDSHPGQLGPAWGDVAPRGAEDAAQRPEERRPSWSVAGRSEVPGAAPAFMEAFADNYSGFQSSLSADQVRASTLAKAHPLSPTSPGGGAAAGSLTGDRPVLPPLSSSGLSRPGTSQGGPSLLPPLSPTQLPSLRPGSSQVNGGELMSRPPTGSGDLGRAFRFRRSSMLDLPEMGLESRPATSSGAAGPNDAGTPSRSVNTRLGTSLSTHIAEKLRPLSSSGRLNSANSNFTFGDPLRSPRTAGNSDAKTSPDGGASSSPFRFQPPPLSSGGPASAGPSRSGPTSASGSSQAPKSAAAHFFKDRPLTSALSSRRQSQPNVTTHDADISTQYSKGDSNGDHRRASLATGSEAEHSTEDYTEGHSKQRPFTSGDVPAPPSRFSNVQASEIARRHAEPARSSSPEYKRPDSSRRVSIASLAGFD